ncbi:MAG: hypothetical protein H6695_08400 [Deferribacteres bacterium]|nr:hypothetical protein [candidate division KSB1 bacterium]MCB9510188.1 hypothetical protein [Deferribacteres bacterium]
MIIRKAPTVLLLLSIFVVSNTFAQKQEKEYYRDESVAGARGAMGLFANGYTRALAAKAFGFKPYSLKNRIASAALAATSYQLISFEKGEALGVRPFKLNKEWYGYWQGYFSAEVMDMFLGTVKKYNGLKFLFGSTFAAATGVMVIDGENSHAWRYAKDGPLTLKKLVSNRHSYWIHFAGSGGLYWVFARHVQSPELALAYTTFFIWMWEVKDGYIRWEDVGFLGGDGFSWADGWAGSIAAAGSYLVNKLLFAEKAKPTILHLGEKQAPQKAQMRFRLQPTSNGLNLRIDF